MTCFDATRLETLLSHRNNTEALKATGVAFIHFFPTDFCQNSGNLILFSMFFLLPFPLAGLKNSWERTRNCRRFSSFSSRPFIRKPQQDDHPCRLVVTAAAFAIL